MMQDIVSPQEKLYKYQPKKIKMLINQRIWKVLFKHISGRFANERLIAKN